MKRFEYKEDEYYFDYEGVSYVNWLNRQGENGWELIKEEECGSHTKVLFKREK